MSPTRMIVALHIVLGLREVTCIVVELTRPFKIISLLARSGLCFPCDDILPCWFSLGCVSGKLILEAIEELICCFVRHFI